MTSSLTPLQERNAWVEKRAWSPTAWQKAVVLRKDVAAIEALPNGGGKVALGMMLQLPRGLQVEICGGGFSEGTVKIRAENDYFFVLRGNVMGQSF